MLVVKDYMLNTRTVGRFVWWIIRHREAAVGLRGANIMVVITKQRLPALLDAKRRLELAFDGAWLFAEFTFGVSFLPRPSSRRAPARSSTAVADGWLDGIRCGGV
jgi:hypothetical protein